MRSSKEILENSEKLFAAIKASDQTLAREIVERCPEAVDVNQEVEGKDTYPLHLALDMGLEDLAAYLANRGAPEILSLADGHGWRPIHYAAYRGLTESVILLSTRDQEGITAGTKPFGLTPLHYACKFNHKEAAITLARLAPDSLKAKDVAGFTPLDQASGDLKLALIDLEKPELGELGEMSRSARLDKEAALKLVMKNLAICMSERHDWVAEDMEDGRTIGFRLFADGFGVYMMMHAFSANTATGTGSLFLEFGEGDYDEEHRRAGHTFDDLCVEVPFRSYVPLGLDNLHEALASYFGIDIEED